ncbi:serine/threonine protein kinase/WD40 repeat protein [Catenulispora sp. MAP5-51]|uniref:WD40 repeat domain-containing serine/threonine protein kinase n=1 Tax=Catenulispora sp. MAP5-51 TaxID=3156298 RepID=UPI003510E107
MAEVVLDGRYRLVRLLGRGGMGEVWRAHDARIGRDVAVKIVTAGGLTGEALARFDREARIIGNLSGPSIVTVHDYGHDEYAGETVPYLVMELVAGRTIADRIRTDGPTSPRTALDWAVQICEALTVAHTAKVIHRDIKPSNVMVSDAGAVKVLDFGIARFVGDLQTGTDLTATGMVVGSAEYMSPEQAQGGALDARSDLYSLGCLLHFALTGRGPFEADTPLSVALLHVSRTPEAPSRYRQGIPAAVDDLVLTLLAKDPQDRPGSALTVGQWIRNLLLRDEDPATVKLANETAGGTRPLPTTAPIPPVPMPAPVPAPMPAPTPAPTPTPATTLATTPIPIPMPMPVPMPTTTPLAALPKENHSRRWFLSGAAAVAVGGAAVGTWLAVDKGSASGSGANSAAGSGANSGAGSSSGPAAALKPAVGTPNSPTSSTSKPAAAPTDPTQVARVAEQKSVNHVAFSPDSKILVSATQDNTARLYDVSDPAKPSPLGVCTHHTAMVFDVAVSPDGRTLATSSYDQTLGLWDIQDPSSPRLLNQVQFGSRLSGVCFSPDGTTVAVGLWSGKVQLIDVRRLTGTLQQWTVAAHSTLAYSVAFSPDGKTLASGSFDKTAKLWDVRNPAAAQLLGTAAGHTDRVFDIAFHPDGDVLATGSGDHSLILFDVSNPAAPTVLTKIAEPDEATGVAFSPDGRLIANGGGASTVVRLYDLTTPAAPRALAPLTGHTGYALGVAFSPDGKLLACADQDNSVLVWRF